jgi:hypothetical protein
MQQRREWREKSGGVIEEGEEAEDIEEVREAEEVAEDVGEIDANGEGSHEIAAGAGVAAAAAFWSVACLISGSREVVVAGEGTALAGVVAG